MNRRELIRAMLGAAAATALPSEVFPFRKIFLPSTPRIYGNYYRILWPMTRPGVSGHFGPMPEDFTWTEFGKVSSVTFTPTLDFSLIR